MEFHAIDYNGGQVYVDKEVPITKGTLFYHPDWGVTVAEDKVINTKDISHKITGQSPNLSIPNIPYVEIEEDDETIYSLARTHVHSEYPNLKGGESAAMIDCFIEGYKASSAKKYSEEDLSGYIDWCSNKGYSYDRSFGWYHSNGHRPNNSELLRLYLQSLQPKVVSIEVEEEWTDDGDTNHDEGGTLPGIIESYKIPITYTKDGKTFLKVKKVNYLPSLS